MTFLVSQSYAALLLSATPVFIVFVCWDQDLIPSKLSQPARYQGSKEPVRFSPISDDERLEYFARYTNASLGRVKNLFLSWARCEGPTSAQCQELNYLFSQCVDGGRIKIPKHLEDPPQQPPDRLFILDTIHEAAKSHIHARRSPCQGFDGFSFDAMQLLLSREDVAMSEFELIKLTCRWCSRNNARLTDFLEYFDFDQLSDEEKTWTLCQVPSSADAPKLILNALISSSLLSQAELHPFKLDYPNLHWKCVFDSTRDRLATFFDATGRILEQFHKKLIVFRADERLTLAMYVPKKIERRQECQVDDTVRMFAFPHSQGDAGFPRRIVPTKKSYRLYCDESSFQLYEGQRRNTWVFIKRPGADNTTYQNIENSGNRRRQRERTVNEGINDDCVTSVALDKFSSRLQKHLGKVNRNPVMAAVGPFYDSH